MQESPRAEGKGDSRDIADGDAGDEEESSTAFDGSITPYLELLDHKVASVAPAVGPLPHLYSFPSSLDPFIPPATSPPTSPSHLTLIKINLKPDRFYCIIQYEYEYTRQAQCRIQAMPPSPAPHDMEIIDLTQDSDTEDEMVTDDEGVILDLQGEDVDEDMAVDVDQAAEENHGGDEEEEAGREDVALALAVAVEHEGLKWTPYHLNHNPLAPARDYLDKINFQRLVILCLLRLRVQDPDVVQDDETFRFLHEPYWEGPWRRLNNPIRAAAEGLERDSWGGVRTFVKRYPNDLKIDPISVDDFCGGCGRAHARCKSYTEVTFSGIKYDKRTLNEDPGTDRERLVCLGTYCFKSALESHRLHHLVYNTFLDFEAKYFARETRLGAIRAALAVEPVDVDAIVRYFHARGVDAAVMRGIWARFDLISQRRAEKIVAEEDEEDEEDEWDE